MGLPGRVGKCKDRLSPRQRDRRRRSLPYRCPYQPADLMYYQLPSQWRRCIFHAAAIRKDKIKAASSDPGLAAEKLFSRRIRPARSRGPIPEGLRLADWIVEHAETIAGGTAGRNDDGMNQKKFTSNAAG